MLLSAFNCLPRRIAGAATLSAALAMPLASWAQGGNPNSPAATAAPVLNDKAPQYWFGVAVENIPPAYAKQLKIHPDQGVIVVHVFANSPAENAKLKPDDILIEINTLPLTSQAQLFDAANQVNTIQVGAGKPVQPLVGPSSIVYLRDGDRHTATLTPALRPNDLRMEDHEPQPSLKAAQLQSQPQGARALTFSNGTQISYGPALPINDANKQDMTVLRTAVGNGETVIVTKESDDQNNIKLTFRQGNDSYTVTPDKLNDLPPKYRPLAQKLLDQGAAPNNHDTSPLAVNPQLTTQEQLRQQNKDIQDLKRQNLELQHKLDQLIELSQPRPAAGQPVNQK